MQPYCHIARHHPVHRYYHDHEYGFPQDAETVLFERLVLEINQAGLSWLTILVKRENLRQAYAGFDVDRVAAMQTLEIDLLMQNTGIIRQRKKIEAIIANARMIQSFRDSHGGFYQWLRSHHPQSELKWVTLFRSVFRFTGPQITREFLMSIGFLPGAHNLSCPIYQHIAILKPAWMEMAVHKHEPPHV